MENTNLLTIFLTGLITGGLTCMAVQGGLLATTIAQREEERLKEEIKTGNAIPILTFLLTKLWAYIILGVLLGWFGSMIQLSLTARLIMQIIVSIFMIGTALNILNVHPIFRYFIIQPPRFLTKLVRKQSKSKDLFAPAILGAFTVFIPCGTTQAMMALAIASGNPLYGAAIMGAFILGTSPIFFLLGYFTTKLSDTLHERFMKVAAYAIILLAIFNVNTAFEASGSNFTISTLAKGVYCQISFCDFKSDKKMNLTKTAAPYESEINLEIRNTGYNPEVITIKPGAKITMHVKNIDEGGCGQVLTIPALNIEKSIPLGSSETITFTAPDKPGTMKFMCPMAMFRGVFKIE